MRPKEVSTSFNTGIKLHLNVKFTHFKAAKACYLEHGHVGKLLPGDEEEGVGELGELADEVEPADDRHSHPVRARNSRPVNILAN